MGITGEYWKTQEIKKLERERDELRERLEIHSEEYKVKDLTIEQKAEILERKVTTVKTKRDVVNPA